MPNPCENTVEHLTQSLFNIRVGIRYHMRRQAFYSLWHRLTGVMSLVFGSAAFAALMGQYAQFSIWLSAAIVLVQALDLIFETAKSSILHESLRQKYISLEAKILHKQGLTEDEFSAIQQDIKHLEIEEPPIKHWLLKECVNAALRVSGYDQADPDEAKLFQQLNTFQRTFKHLY
ncbi:hypothetical protein [Spongiibacter sp. UBA1325]|uniref:hypothetical protein n=1 Tax=Spongiibacter sp. UBA1325 TaxID=1947543 RepID=UPI002580E8A5|nr:hypothetical protein [Spongiibacter sp. UBA1325]